MLGAEEQFHEQAKQRDLSLLRLIFRGNVQQPQSFDGEEWAEDNDYDMKVGERSEEYFDDKWGEELDDEGVLEYYLDS